jgi:hypothetical protein
VRAGRNVEVQRIQVEGAIRIFVTPSLAERVTYEADVVEELAAPGGAVTATHVGRAARAFRATAQFGTLQGAGRIRESRPRTTSTLRDRIRSTQGLTVLFDRAVQEGPGTGSLRLVAALRWVADDRGLADITAVDPHEQRVLDRVLDDLEANIAIAHHIDAAVAAIDALERAAAAPGATVPAVLAAPEAVRARTELDGAVAAVPRKLDLTGRHFAPTRPALEAGLPTERGALDFMPPPATIGALRSALQGASTRLGRLRPNTVRATTWRDRTHDILRSTLAAPPPPPP